MFSSVLLITLRLHRTGGTLIQEAVTRGEETFGFRQKRVIADGVLAKRTGW